jgi:hypothetical protein
MHILSIFMSQYFNHKPNKVNLKFCEYLNLDVTLNASHLIYGLLTNTHGDLAHKDKQQNMFLNFMRVMLKQVALPWEAPSQDMVLNVFNGELIFASLDPIITIGITYPFILASLSIGLVVDSPPSFTLVHNEFPHRL